MMKKVKMGLAGLGRLGICHCKNLLYKIPNADVVAACSIVPEELDEVKRMGIGDVYGDYEAMLTKSGVEAVVLATPTNMHAEQIMMALERRVHVFCEKPLAISHEDCLPILKKAAETPETIVQIGFVRRFDNAYMDAYKRIQEGQIGKVFRVHSHTSDWTEFATFQIKFSQTSGGIFHDYNIHDIDLIHWLSGARFKSVHSLGGSYKYPDFEKMSSADNTLCLAELDNGGMATISASRTEAHGHGTHTIVHGTEGTLSIGFEPAATRVKIFDAHGVRQECVKTFYERFEEAFIEELSVFADCVANGKPSSISLKDAAENTRVAVAMTKSFETKKIVFL